MIEANREDASTYCFEISLDSNFMALGLNDGVEIWSLNKKPNLMHKLTTYQKHVKLIAFSIDRKFLMSRIEEVFQIWDIQNNLN